MGQLHFLAGFELIPNSRYIRDGYIVLQKARIIRNRFGVLASYFKE